MELNGRERAQLLLIGSVVIAVAILGTVVLLNTIHVPADVSAQNDAQSVKNAEQVTGALEHDLRELTRAHTSIKKNGTALPYVDDSDNSFTTAVENYSAQYTNLSSRTSPSVVSIEYVATNTVGAVAYQNETGDVADGIVLNASDSVPRLYMNATISNPTESANISFRNVDINVTSSGIFTGGSRVGECNPGVGTQVEVNLYSGNGTVRTDGSTCGELNLPVSGSESVQITSTGFSAEGTYAISVVNAGAGPGAEKSAQGVEVNPTFDVVYQDSNGAYETRFSVFGGDG